MNGSGSGLNRTRMCPLLFNGETTMAISSIPGYSSSAPIRTSAASCPTCGNAGNAKASTAQSFSKGYTGRDSYVCASCGQQKPASSSYCPTCSGNSSAKSSNSPARTTTFPSTAGNAAYNCPTCNKGGSASSAASKSASAFTSNSLSWVR